MDIVEILKQDYQRFPKDQTYSLYAEDLFFQDPMNKFRGLKLFKLMIGFIDTWFKDVKMDLHSISRTGNLIEMEWTLKWTTPLPWQPCIAIPGKTELKLNEQDLIISQVDYWHCSRWDVIRQHFSS